ncbi:MAG TPA: hypothetical protein VK498_01500, partial [Ferruginibacter sp.]|nr:hypothetical protein [Ferruginibacter sp.]
KKRIPEDPEDLLLRTLIAERKDQPIETPAQDFTFLNYNAVGYYKSSQWLTRLEKELGTPLFDSLMHEYYNRWKFKHPYPEDFKAISEEVSGRNLDHVFSLLQNKGNIVAPGKKDFKFIPFFSLKETSKYNYIFIAPAVGYNLYDKLMIGGLVHNYTLPLNKLRFFVSPLYGTGSKTLNGIGRISYTGYLLNKGQIEFAIAGAKFSGGSFSDSVNPKSFLPFNKIVPSVKYTFHNKIPRSTIKKYIQWKSYLIKETGLLFSFDTTQQAFLVTSHPITHRYINQLRFVIENNRVLYPFKVMLHADQGDGFIRPDITASYYFNYPKGGGLNLRFYAGKFIYTEDQTLLREFQTDRYHLTLSGANGNEDYTYSNYFFGRNEFEGFSSQQIMIRDGGFKVRTDLLNSKVGKSDDWLSAINLNTTIPKEINPFELLPIKIPVRLFADIGTYAEAWKKDGGSSRFLYDAGLQVSLCKDVVNIYIPILYSKTYADYFKSYIEKKRFIKNISFSIDLQNISINKLIPQSPF